MITLDQILKHEFQNIGRDKIVSTLSKHKLYDFLSEVISLLNTHIENKTEELKSFGTLQVSPIASALLVRINEYLRQLSKQKKIEQKKELEYVLGNITKRIIKLIIDQVPNHSKALQLKSIEIGLRDTCELYNYDFEKLSEFIQIDDLVREIYVEFSGQKEAVQSLDVSLDTSLPGFRCCADHNKKQLPLLLKLIKDLEISTEIEKIEKLFHKPKENLAIKLNENKATYVMQFWVKLATSKFIESDNEKYGFYQVLECHVLKFKEVFLKGKDGQRGADRVRKLKDWEIRKAEFEGYFKKLI